MEEGGWIEVAGGWTDWVEGDIELGSEAEEVHYCADVGTVYAEGGFEGEFVDTVALVFPTKE